MMDTRSIIYTLLNESFNDSLYEVEEKDVKVDLRRLTPYGRRKHTSRKSLPPKKDYGVRKSVAIHPDDIEIDLSDIEPEPPKEVGSLITNQSVLKDKPKRVASPNVIQGNDIFRHLVRTEGISVPDCMVQYALSSNDND